MPVKLQVLSHHNDHLRRQAGDLMQSLSARRAVRRWQGVCPQKRRLQLLRQKPHHEQLDLAKQRSLSPSSYFVRPDEDKCQPCPRGSKCQKQLYPWWRARLGGRSRRSIEDSTAADQQRCIPRAEGSECELEVCETCSTCAAGKYKEQAGPQACYACLQNTYNPRTNSKALVSCLSCPFGSDTGGLDGQTSPNACQCGESFYLANAGSGSSTISCVNCPSGAICPGTLCAPDVGAKLHIRQRTHPRHLGTVDVGGICRQVRARELSFRTTEANHLARHAKVPPMPRAPVHHPPDDDICQKCSLGLQCRGDDVVVPVLESST